MGRVTSTSYSSTTNTTGHSQTQSQSQSKSQSTTQKMIDEKLRDQILAGLMGYMTDEEIGRYAENLLRPELDARLEAAQQTYDTAKLGREQEMEGLAAALTRSIADQERIYAKNAAGVQTAALARGMGRSSYTLQALANEGREHARLIGEMTAESERKREDLAEQISLADAQRAKTQGRLKADYAKELAAKIQELRQQQRRDYNSDYLTAVSGSMGSQTSGQSSTSGSSETDSTSKSKTHGSSTTVSGSTGGSGKKKKESNDQVDAISGAAPRR